MADARLRGAWLGKMKFDDLSDRAWRVFTSALMWSVEQGTDGRIPDRYLKHLHPDGDQPDAVAELVAAGLAERSDEGLLLLDWSGELGQSTAAQIEDYRRNARDRQRRRRQRVSDTSEQPDEGEGGQLVRSDFGPRDVTSNVTRDITRDVGNGYGKGKGLQETALSPFCARHPGGTTEPCGACRTARLHFEHEAISKPTPTPRAQLCPTHPGWPHPESHAGCDRCKEDAAREAS